MSTMMHIVYHVEDQLVRECVASAKKLFAETLTHEVSSTRDVARLVAKQLAVVYLSEHKTGLDIFLAPGLARRSHVDFLLSLARRSELGVRLVAHELSRLVRITERDAVYLVYDLLDNVSVIDLSATKHTPCQIKTVKLEDLKLEFYLRCRHVDDKTVEVYVTEDTLRDVVLFTLYVLASRIDIRIIVRGSRASTVITPHRVELLE